MRRLLGAALVVSALALVACAGPAEAQTPTPPPATVPDAIPWNEAQLQWPPPTEFANGGGSLADCATGPCGMRYIVEAKAPGGNGWGPIAVVDVPNYRVRGLWPGIWYFRVKAFWGLTGYSLPGPIATKTVVEPLAAQPVVTPPTTTTVK